MTELEELLQIHAVLAERLLLLGRPDQNVEASFQRHERIEQYPAADTERAEAGLSNPHAAVQKAISMFAVGPESTDSEPHDAFEEEMVGGFDRLYSPPEEASAETVRLVEDQTVLPTLQAKQISRIFERDARRYDREECLC